jgi:hypothetical protein
VPLLLVFEDYELVTCWGVCVCMCMCVCGHVHSHMFVCFCVCWCVCVCVHTCVHETCVRILARLLDSVCVKAGNSSWNATPTIDTFIVVFFFFSFYLEPSSNMHAGEKQSPQSSKHVSSARYVMAPLSVLLFQTDRPHARVCVYVLI